MFAQEQQESPAGTALDGLDRAAIAYLTFPLVLFVVGWYEIWVSIPLAACMAYALKPLTTRRPAAPWWPVTRLQFTVAISVAVVWTLLGGIGHLAFTNADWHIRDAVLHDLVASSWPVGYGMHAGQETLLRAPLAYFLPAALGGKLFGLSVAHWLLSIWTAAGAALFLLQILSLTPSRIGIAVMVTAVIVFFSGFDIIGSLLNDGPRFRQTWSIATHLEWWAGTYQYSSITTQLFWVPNHAIAAWLTVGMLYRNRGVSTLDSTLPIVVVAGALWSPLSVLGVMPFVLWKVFVGIRREQFLRLLHPHMWAPALAVGCAITAFIILDPSQIPRGMTLGAGGAHDTTMAILRQAQFFLLEAGFIGYAILAIQRSTQVRLALIILALLPLASFGPNNDLVMRASIPSLAVLAIASCLALSRPHTDRAGLRKKLVLGGMLVIGALTPIQEFARAILVQAWPINLQATLIGANCGGYPTHYIARLGDQAVKRILRSPHALSLGPQNHESCDNPAIDLMVQAGLR
jgi:hypothetical protein